MSDKKIKAIRRALRKEIRKADIEAKKPRYITKFLWRLFVKRAQLIFGEVGIKEVNPEKMERPREWPKPPKNDYEIGPILAFVYTGRTWWQLWKPKKVYGDVGQYTKTGDVINVLINGGFYLTGKNVTIRGIPEKPKED